MSAKTKINQLPRKEKEKRNPRREKWWLLAEGQSAVGQCVLLVVRVVATGSRLKKSSRGDWGTKRKRGWQSGSRNGRSSLRVLLFFPFCLLVLVARLVESVLAFSYRDKPVLAGTGKRIEGHVSSEAGSGSLPTTVYYSCPTGANISFTRTRNNT